MSYELNKKLKSIEPYEPETGEYPIRLDANESCFDISEKLGDVIIEAVRKVEFNRYPDPTAKKVTEAFAEFYGLNPDHCTAGNGSDELISLILSSFLDKGDTVVKWIN